MKYPSQIIKAADDFPAKSLIKPDIHPDDNTLPVFTGGMNYRDALKKLESGPGLKIQGSYPTAIAFYSWIKKMINLKHPVKDYPSSRITKNILYEITGKIMVMVRHHAIDLKNSPHIPWLKDFYPDNQCFLISLPDILGMNGAWQWFDKGIGYPVLPQAIHPFYGVYFPTRTHHLAMLDRWLENHAGQFSEAVDVGTGCGILGLLMAKHGIGKIYATDINPNAVYSTSLEIDRFRLQGRMTVERASFFGSQREIRGLVIFNPPWIPGKYSSLLDRGVYYEGNFLEEFLVEAGNKLVAGTTLIIIFSTFAAEAGITDHNPVERAVNQNDNFILADKITASNEDSNRVKSTSWLTRIRNREKIEIWVLEKV
jgi:hypothetical protein